MKILTNLDLNRNQIQNVVIHPLATAPANPVAGQIYYNTTDDIIYKFNGTSWDSIGVGTITKADVGLDNVDNTSDATKKTNFTGSIEENGTGFVVGGDIFTALGGKLDKTGGTMSGNLAMGSNKITGLGTPTNDADAVTKAYVDGLIAGLGTYLDWIGSVQTTNDLPTTGMRKGDVYTVAADGSDWVWTSTSATGTVSDYEELGRNIAASGYLATTGGTMSGAIAMGSNKITGLANGTASGDAVNFSQLQGLIKIATGTIATNASSAIVSFTGTLIHAFAIMSGEEVQLDKTISSGSVTFATASNPASTITCTVVYA